MPPNPIDEVALEGRLARIEESQKALNVRVGDGFTTLSAHIDECVTGLRGDLARYLDEQKEQAKQVRELELEQAQHRTALASHATAMGEQKRDVDKLRGRINTWGGGNSLAIAVGYLISLLRGEWPL